MAEQGPLCGRPRTARACGPAGLAWSEHPLFPQKLGIQAEEVLARAMSKWTEWGAKRLSTRPLGICFVESRWSLVPFWLGDTLEADTARVHPPHPPPPMDFGVSTMGLVLVLVTGAQNCALCICSVLDGASESRALTE